MSTPGRATRQRSKTPLPAVAAKQNVAYGTRGKAELRSQIRGQQDDFAAAFAGGRSEAGGGASALPSVSERDEGSEEPGPERPVPIQQTTAMDSMAEYQGGTAAPKQLENERERPAILSNYQRSFLWLFGLICLLSGVLLCAVPLPSSRIEAGRHNILSGIRLILHAKPYDVPPDHLAYLWFRFRHDQIMSETLPDHNVPEMQWAFNLNFLTRLETLEERVASLESDMSFTNETLREMRRILPANVILRQINGKLEIPQDFWQALQERMVEDSELAPLWRAFILRNENEMKQVQRAHIQSVFDEAVENRHIITGETFTSLIQEHNDWLAKEYSQEIKKIWRENTENIEALAHKSATDMIDHSLLQHFAGTHVNILIRANQIHNMYQALRDVNFLSAIAGARVDPEITSPTARPTQPNWLASLWYSLSARSRANPPITALMKWDEATECWCGSSEVPGGPVNLGIIAYHNFYPDSLVVEHIPPEGTTEISAAPRQIEVWVDTGSKKIAQQYAKIIADKDAISLQPHCGPTPKEGFVCLGTSEYDIHGPNHVQSFKVWDMAELYKLPPSKRVIVRVNSNWGANHTCIYRVRLTGQKA